MHTAKWPLRTHKQLNSYNHRRVMHCQQLLCVCGHSESVSLAPVNKAMTINDTESQPQ